MSVRSFVIKDGEFLQWRCVRYLDTTLLGLLFSSGQTSAGCAVCREEKAASEIRRMGMEGGGSLELSDAGVTEKFRVRFSEQEVTTWP